MKPTKIIVNNEIGREMSPFSIIKKEDYYPAPGIEDGEHLAYLQWQIKTTKGWSNLRDDEIELYTSSNAETKAIWVKAIDVEGLPPSPNKTK